MSILEIILYSVIGIATTIWVIVVIRKAIKLKKNKAKGIEEDED